MSSETLGQRAAAALKAAKVEAQTQNRTLSWSEVATIIDGCTVQAVPLDDPAKFGDRKKVPPTPEQVTAYSASIGYPMNGQAWCDSYEVKGWKVGKERMKDWQAAVRTWKANGYGKDGIALAGAVGGKSAQPRDYRKL